MAGKSTVTVDPGSSPDHDKLGVELGKVKCLLGGGGTHRTYKDGTKPYYKRAPCYLREMRESFMTFSKDTDGNGQGGGRRLSSWGRGCNPKTV